MKAVVVFTLTAPGAACSKEKIRQRYAIKRNGGAQLIKAAWQEMEVLGLGHVINGDKGVSAPQFRE